MLWRTNINENTAWIARVRRPRTPPAGGRGWRRRSNLPAHLTLSNLGESIGARLRYLPFGFVGGRGNPISPASSLRVLGLLGKGVHFQRLRPSCWRRGRCGCWRVYCHRSVGWSWVDDCHRSAGWGWGVDCHRSVGLGWTGREGFGGSALRRAGAECFASTPRWAGGLGFADRLWNLLRTVWAIPRDDRPPGGASLVGQVSHLVPLQSPTDRISGLSGIS